jgi:hypothetical protein
LANFNPAEGWQLTIPEEQACVNKILLI